jgi:flagellar secretion chaperone FliS
MQGRAAGDRKTGAGALVDAAHTKAVDPMSYGTSSSRYLEAEIMSRPKEWLVPLMYEHLLSNLRRADIQIESGDIEGKAASLEKAQSIVMELIGCLDFARGGEIASRLSALYSYFATEIMTVGRSLDREQLGRLIEMIVGLHEAWTQAAEAMAPRTRPGGTQVGLPAA